MRLLACLLLIVSLCGFRPFAPAADGPVELEVLDRDADSWLPQRSHRGEAWIAGTPGHRYAVRLHNRGGQRVLAVLSVDGVNAVSGQTAAADQRGYVLAPGQSIEVAGWRKSQHEVAQFVFTGLDDSYAARTGRPDNVGVIGIAVFDEAQPVMEESAVAAAASARPAPAPLRRAESAAGDMARGEQRLGTGHGEREWSPATTTVFVRASATPTQLSQLRYDSHARLVARGVIPMPKRQPRFARAPQAFPGGFVADPPPR